MKPLKPVYSGCMWDNYDDDRTVAENVERLAPGAVVVGYKPADYREFAEYSPSVILYNEIRWKRFIPEVRDYKPDVVVFHHLNDFEKWQEWVVKAGSKPVHIPHVACPEIFYPQENRPIDFLLAGALSSKVYPLRALFVSVIKELRRRGLNAIHWQHPGHEVGGAQDCRHVKAMAEAFRKTKVVGCCASIYKYRLTKFVEAAASGCAVASDLPVSEDDMSQFVIECDHRWTVDKAADVVQAGIETWSDMGAAGIEYAKKHTPETYCERLKGAVGCVANRVGSFQRPTER